MTTIKTPWYSYYHGVRPHLDYPDISMYQMLVRSVEQHSNLISYHYFGTQRTYQEFLAEVNQCADAFLYLGVKEGDRVSICMPNTPEAIISFYALNKIGAVANMIHPLSAANEIKYYLNVSDSKYMVAADFTYQKIHPIEEETLLKKCILVSVGESMPLFTKLGFWMSKGRKIKVPFSELTLPWKEFFQSGKKDVVIRKTCREETTKSGQGDKLAAILYSGGTTGYPKGIGLTNLNFNALAMQSFEACQCLKAGDTVLAIMPVFHGFGLGICIHTVQFFGGTSILLPQFQVSTFDRLLTKYRPNVIAGVPTLYEAMLRSQSLRKYDLSFLKCVISGGDSLSVGLKKKVDSFLKEHGANIQIREGYGLTECVTGSCLTPMEEYREGSIGIPYPDTYYKIVKPGTEEELPYGEEGEILISGPTVMQGYLNHPEETNEVLKIHADGYRWLYTGDYGSMDKDGFVYFKQRIKRVIISSGYNIFPQYIENVMDSHEKVLMSCAIGMPHPYKIQVVKVFVVLKAGVSPNEEVREEIKAYCEKNLAKYSWPYEYEFREELPRTLVGKVAYTVLEEEERKKRRMTGEENDVS